jgi:hypothetical protein
MIRARAGLGLLLAVLLLGGCGQGPCPPGVSHHDTFTVVVSSSSSLACANMGSCDTLCMDLATSHANARVEVQSCMRVDADGGADDAGADAGGQQQVTVDVSYLAFPFCGT